MQKELIEGVITKLLTITGIGTVERFSNQYEEANRVREDGSPRSGIASIKYPAVFVSVESADYRDLTRGEQLIDDQVICLHICHKGLDDESNADIDFKQTVYYNIHGFYTTYWNRLSRFREEWDSNYTNTRVLKQYYKCSARDKYANRPRNTQVVDPVTPVIENEPQIATISKTGIRTDEPIT